MKMQLATIFLVKVLSCLLLLCLCSSAPTDRDGTNSARRSRSPFVRYTPQEDQLIVNEIVSSVPNGLITQIFARKIWEPIAEKIHERHIAGVQGFPQERSYVNLRYHFREMAMRDTNKTGVEIPTYLKQRILESISRSRGRRNLSSPSSQTEETDFQMIDEEEYRRLAEQDLISMLDRDRQ